jgi:hypothetical protein
MDLTTPLLNGAILALFTAILAWLGKGRFEVFDRRFDALDARLESMERRIDALDRRIELLTGEMAQLRSDLLQVALSQRPATG